jgi:hypothetical protein
VLQPRALGPGTIHWPHSRSPSLRFQQERNPLKLVFALCRPPLLRHASRAGGPLQPGRPIFQRTMATRRNDIQGLRESNRQLREALRDCHQLLERSELVLRKTQQDNDPVYTD